jgi:hypothetical protein
MARARPLEVTEGRDRRGLDPAGGSDWRARTGAWVAWALPVAALGLAGCTPSIGARCTLSTDCSSQGDRVCDTAETAGYCTVLNCTANSCPDNAACILFQVSVPGCAYNDYSAPGRTGVAMCMKTCNHDSDCRESDAYVCANPRAAPWYAAIVDDNQGESVCIAATSSSASPPPSDTGVCGAMLPPLPDAGTAGADGGGDASPSDAEATDSAIDGGLEEGADAAADSAYDAGPDVAADATLGGDAEIDSAAADGAADALDAADAPGDED